MFKIVGNLWREFVAFAFKGNLVDLAVGFVIGTAFSGLVKALVDDIVMPIVNYLSTEAKTVGPTTRLSTYAEWTIGPVRIGAFLGELLNFVIIAGTVFFIIVKLIGLVTRRLNASAAAAGPTTKECPLCLSVIPIAGAQRAHCTADLAAPA